MIKLKTLFKKDSNHKATSEIQCLWVANDGVKAYIKRDGTACMIKKGVLYKRYDAKINKKTGKRKTPPIGAISCCPPDNVTGHWPHWVKCGEGDKYHAEAFNCLLDKADGTYELCGPKINGNNEKLTTHVLINHKSEPINQPLVISYSGFSGFLSELNHEGVVFYGPNNEMCKLRRVDFGFSWPNE
jgi:hypothetical protein